MERDLARQNRLWRRPSLVRSRLKLISFLVPGKRTPLPAERVHNEVHSQIALAEQKIRLARFGTSLANRWRLRMFVSALFRYIRRSFLKFLPWIFPSLLFSIE